jgi:hypothetical protein
MSLFRSIARALLAVASWPSAALACTPAIGVDPAAFYRMMALPGELASGVSVLAAVVWLIVRRTPKGSRAAILIALALLNPGWWLWGIGDCGTLAFWTGGVFAVLSLVTLGQGLWRRHVLGRTTNVALGV